jgi:F-type H+-transporting ATPase subunit alpha
MAQKQLDRGYRMVEVLKQKQFSPMSVSDEVISILAGSSGVLDDVDAAHVGHFLEELIEWLKLEAGEYLDEINKTGKLSDELLSALNDAVAAYKTIFKFSFGA